MNKIKILGKSLSKKDFKMNKRGAEMTIGTIIIIILALVVLVVIIYGFTTGWTGLWDNIVNFIGGKNNVEKVIQACQVACTTQANYNYCTLTRSISFEGADGKFKTVKATCKQLQDRTPLTDDQGKPATLPTTDLTCSMACA